MKLHITLITIFCFQCIGLAQVGINTTDPKATLSIEASSLTNPSNTDGLLIPKIEEFPSTNPTVDQDGMQVFVTGDGSVLRGFYYWDSSSTTWTTISSTASPSADWYENGTTTNPDDIADAMYTMGAVGIGVQPTIGNLEIMQSTNEITATFDNTTTTSPNGLTTLEGIKNTLSGTTNSIPQIGIHTALSGNGTNKQISIENNFTGTAFGTRRGVQNNFTDTKGNIVGSENNFSGDVQGSRAGMHNNFLDANSGASNGAINSFSGAGNTSAFYLGTQNGFSKSDYAVITGTSNSITTDGGGLSRGLFNGFNGSGTGHKVGVSNIYFASNQGGNQTAIDNRFEGDADMIIVGMRNQFQNTSASSLKIGVTNILSGPTSSQAIGTSNSVATSGNGSVIGTVNSVGNGLFNMTAEAFGVQNRLYPKSTTNAFGILNDFDFDENTGQRYGLLNRFNSIHTGDKIGIQNQFTANNTETINGLINLFNGTGGDQNGMFNSFTAISSGAQIATKNLFNSSGTNLQIGSENSFIGTGTSEKRGAINNFTNLVGGTAYGTLNEFNNLNGASATGLNNVFSGNNDLSIYGTQNVFNNTGDGALYGSSTVINASGSGFKYGHYVRIPPSAGGFHVGLYSEALKSTAVAALFRGRVQIGSVFGQEYTFPVDRGTVGQTLVSDGVGNLGWASSSGFWQRSGTTLSLLNPGDAVQFSSAATSITFPAISSAAPSMFYLFDSGTTNTDRMIFSQSATYSNYGLMYRDLDDSFRFLRNGSDRVVINVGAVSTPLVVTGTVQATSFQSATTTYPDYVFDHYYEGSSAIDPNYSFPTLEEVERFIKENGHLPGVLPFSEVKNRGMQIDLASSAMTNLEKIEELFLYTIELRKQNEQINAENQSLKRQQESMLKRLGKIEEKLN